MGPSPIVPNVPNVLIVLFLACPQRPLFGLISLFFLNFSLLFVGALCYADFTMSRQEDERRNLVQMVGIFMTIPFVLAVPPVIGWFAGKWLDKWLGTEPWLAYVLLVLGFIAGGRELIRILKKYGDTRGTGL